MGVVLSTAASQEQGQNSKSGTYERSSYYAPLPVNAATFEICYYWTIKHQLRVILRSSCLHVSARRVKIGCPLFCHFLFLAPGYLFTLFGKQEKNRYLVYFVLLSDWNSHKCNSGRMELWLENYCGRSDASRNNAGSRNDCCS